MKHELKLFGVCLLLAIQGCTSEVAPPKSDIEDEETIVSRMVVKFENRVYETDVVVSGDSVKYLNEAYAEVYRTRIANASDIAALTSQDENGTTYVEYFPSEKKLLESYSFMGVEQHTSTVAESATRAGVIDMWPSNGSGKILAVAELYDDRNFRDTKLISYATNYWATAIPKLSDVGFNDKCSSIRVINNMRPGELYQLSYKIDNNPLGNTQYMTLGGSALRPVLKCFHNSGYSGIALYCIGTPTGSSSEHLDYNLKSIGWNDRISSIAWLIVTNFDAFAGENPEIPAHDPC